MGQMTAFPFPPQSLSDLWEQSVNRHSKQVALSFYGKEIRYAELHAQINRFACALYESGIRKGDRVGIMLPNCPQYVIAFYGIVKLGAVVVQINPMSMEKELHFFLSDSGATALVIYAPLAERIINRGMSQTLKKMILVEWEHSGQPVSSPGVFFDEFLRTCSFASVPPVSIDPLEDLAVLQYTGGTTGRVKGAMLTHANLVANAYQNMEMISEVGQQERILTVVPLFHIYGMSICMNMGFLIGASLILLPRFHLEEVLQTIGTTKPTIFPGVPTMYGAIHSHAKVDEYPLSSVRVCVVGSAPMPVEVLKGLEKRTGTVMLEGYGLTEASPVTHVNPLHKRKPGSIGVPVMGTEAKIVDIIDGSTELPPGEVGELVVRGPQIMKGYWNSPEETRHTLRDGWLYTGDLAKYDEDGYYYIVDRKKEMIIAGGYNIYPREVEEVIYSHPAVQEAAVVGVPDEYRGETVKAYIVVKEGAQLTEEELIQYCRQHISAYKVPRFVEFRTRLPKTAVGKILRRVLKEESEKEN